MRNLQSPISNLLLPTPSAPPPGSHTTAPAPQSCRARRGQSSARGQRLCRCYAHPHAERRSDCDRQQPANAGRRGDDYWHRRRLGHRRPPRAPRCFARLQLWQPRQPGDLCQCRHFARLFFRDAYEHPPRSPAWRSPAQIRVGLHRRQCLQRHASPSLSRL
jgi:hypothetical protein